MANSYILMILWHIFQAMLNHCGFVSSGSPLKNHTPLQILSTVESSCFIAAVTDNAKPSLISDLEKLASIFEHDKHVVIGLIESTESFYWPSGERLQFVLYNTDIVVFPRVVKDRTCLLTGTASYPKVEHYSGSRNLGQMLDYINSKCGTFRTITGQESILGLHRKYILSNLFHTSNVSNVSINSMYQRKIYKEQDENLNRISEVKMKYSNYQVDSKDVSEDDFCGLHTNADSSDKLCSSKESKSQMPSISTCGTVSDLTKEEFLHDYLKQSKPVIIKNAIQHWPAFKKWTNDFLRDQYGEREVHIKLSPGGDYEGVEKAEKWSDYSNFKIPPQVKEQLKFPDLVVVRPATLDIKFSKFLDMIEKFSNENGENGTAYLEYSSIPEYMPQLEKDLLPFSFLGSTLVRKHLNIWLSDGHTLGRLHFDPYDNLLCQISGKKQVLLFDPHNNEKLYEAHIPEAMLSYDEQTRTFRRKVLKDSTSMVMSPIDLKQPDLERFPLFGAAVPLNCTINEGDVLFMPAFWWHEVKSSPSPTQHRNLAINFWYEPFLRKEFPCAECRLDVNPAYYHLLH